MRTFSTTSWSKLSSSFSRASRWPSAISRLQLPLELVELELDLLRGAALLVDGGDALLEVHAGLDRAEHFVAGAEDAVEQPELLVEQLVDALVGGVVLVEEVDDHHVEFLAVAVAAADALLDALRVPGQVVVDDEIAELKVDALGGGLGRDQDAASSRKCSTSAARMSALGEPLMRSVPACFASQRCKWLWKWDRCSCR